MRHSSRAERTSQRHTVTPYRTNRGHMDQVRRSFNGYAMAQRRAQTEWERPRGTPRYRHTHVREDAIRGPERDWYPPISSGLVTVINHRPRYQIPTPEEVASLLNRGTIAGVTRAVYRPAPIDYNSAEAKISEHDGAIRRKLQLPLRGMIANPQWAFKQIDPTEPYLSSDCKRCARMSFTPHDPNCTTPTDVTGIMCAYCGRVSTDRNAYGKHSVLCYAAKQHYREVEVIQFAFREERAITTETCPVAACSFRTHIYAMWNVHRTIHRYLCFFAKGTQNIYLGEVSKWTYNSQDDTLTPPIDILRTYGSCARWIHNSQSTSINQV